MNLYLLAALLLCVVRKFRGSHKRLQLILGERSPRRAQRLSHAARTLRQLAGGASRIFFVACV